MTLAEAKKRHVELVDEIRGHDDAYYNRAAPTISDPEYDLLYQELLDLECKFPSLITAESPSQRVGGKPVGWFDRVEHRLPMLSLEKIKASNHPTKEEEPDNDLRKRKQDENTIQALKAFDNTIQKHLGKKIVEYVIEPKVDGVSISVHYRNGKLAAGVTRGDGRMGDDITTNIRTIRAIPLELKIRNPPELLEVRGEAYISIKEFEELNEELKAAGEEPFPNARNATAGTLKQLDPRLVAQRPISAVFYSVGAIEGISFSSHAEILESLKEFGLPTQGKWWLCNGIDEVLERYRSDVVANYDETKDLRTKLPYDVDGIVIKLNDVADAERIPPKTRAPGNAIVHKPIPWITPAETIVRGITIQVGRTGVLTPVAELEPVFVQGSTISRASLHNEDEIARKDIRIGDTVVIRKAGMVIPEVVEVVKARRPADAKPFNFLEHIGGKCPVCGGVIAREDVSAGDKKEVAWRCQNVAQCPAQKTRRIEYFAQRRALDIESLGGIVAEKLVERGLVNEPLDLFRLTVDELAKLNLGTDKSPRVFGEKNATKVVEALERAKTMPLARWLYALAIENVGDVVANDIASLHQDFQHIARSRILSGIVQLGKLYEEREKISPYKRKNKPRSDDEWTERKQRFDEIKREIRDLGEELEQIGGASRSAKWRELEEKGSEAVPDFLPAVGFEVARSATQYFDSENGRNTLKRLADLGIDPKGQSGNSEKALSGKAFVLTGTLSSMPRDKAAEEIRKRGGSVSSSVSVNTDFLVAGEEAGSKLDKARELGVVVIGEKQFLEMLETLGSAETEKSESPGKGEHEREKDLFTQI